MRSLADRRRVALVRRRQIAGCAALVAACAAAAYAGFTFSTAPAPGGFVQVCAAPSTSGGSPWPGADLTPECTAAGADFKEASFSGNATAERAASSSATALSNSCHGRAGLGFIQAYAVNNAPNSSSFAQATANAGWSETFVISNAALTGQAGYMQFTLHVQGTLAASGFAGSARFIVTGYKDAAQLMINPLFSPGNSDLLSTDRQYGNWSIATFGNPPTDGKTVSGTVTFAVPFTFGTPFKVGIYARAAAGMRSSSGVPGNSTAEANFLNGLTWGGITGIFNAAQAPVQGSTVASGSGLDWTGPLGPPNPADLNGDGVVNGADLGMLLAAWGTPAGDLNGDGTTDGADLGVLLAAWS
jgi:hypothetical protein